MANNNKRQEDGLLVTRQIASEVADHDRKRDRLLRLLDVNPDDYSFLQLTEEEMASLRLRMTHFATGACSAIPLTCKAGKCPFSAKCPFLAIKKAPIGKPCHPAGEKVLTTQYGYVPIEDLDPTIHKLVSYERKGNAIRFSRNRKNSWFKKGKRQYSGRLITVRTIDGKSFRCTADHICIAQFNERAVGKFAVYLMRRGNAFRIGKTQVVGACKSGKYSHKTFPALLNRVHKEDADSIWVLGIFDTNTEALLAEDYFSATWQTSKACFLTRPQRGIKWDGLYKWVTQEQLDTHHKRFEKDESFYRSKLDSIGLSLDHPFWSSREDTDDFKFYSNKIMFVRACNLLPEIMDVPVIPREAIAGVSEPNYRRRKRGIRFYQAGKEAIVSVSAEDWSGEVYSLEVSPYESYFIDNIATHNCLVEINLLNEWRRNFIIEYDIDPESTTELALINELAEIELLQWRLNMGLSRPENAELVQDETVAVDRDGNVHTKRVVSALMQAKETLMARRARVIKLMVGDRQEKYKREAALKIRSAQDPSQATAVTRRELQQLISQATKANKELREASPSTEEPPVSLQEPDTLSPDDLIAQAEDSDMLDGDDH